MSASRSYSSYRAVPRLPTAALLPSGLKSTLVTEISCPLKCRSSSPVSASHSWKTFSLQRDARPLAKNSIEDYAPHDTPSAREGAAVPSPSPTAPQPHALVRAASRQHHLAVRAVGHAVNAYPVTLLARRSSFPVSTSHLSHRPVPASPDKPPGFPSGLKATQPTPSVWLGEAKRSSRHSLTCEAGVTTCARPAAGLGAVAFACGLQVAASIAGSPWMASSRPACLLASPRTSSLPSCSMSRSMSGGVVFSASWQPGTVSAQCEDRTGEMTSRK